MDTQVTESPVLSTEYTDKRFNAIEVDYFRDINDQMTKTRGGTHYFRTNHAICLKDLARALRLLQYWHSMDGNLDFPAEEILKKLTARLYSDGSNWWSNSLYGYSEKIQFALEDTAKMTRAFETVTSLFPHITN